MEYDNLQQAWQHFIKEWELQVELKAMTISTTEEHSSELHMYASDETIRRFTDGYRKDKTFKALKNRLQAEGIC